MKHNKIKFLSLMGPDTKTSYGIMTQVYKNCDMSQHQFLITSYEDCMDRFPKLYEFDNLMFIPHNTSRLGRIKFLYNMIKNSEHVIWHSLFFASKKYIYFLYFFRHLLRKSVWVEWGADLYLWELNNDSLKNRIMNYMNRKIRESFGTVAFTFPVNEQVYFKQFKNRPRTFYTPMPNPMSNATELMEFIDEQKPVEEELIDSNLQNNENCDLNEAGQIESEQREIPTIDYQQLWFDFLNQICEDAKSNNLNDEHKNDIQRVADFLDYLKNAQAIVSEESESSKENESSLEPKDQDTTPPIRVQVAHNSFTFNNHVKLLNDLEQFADKNIQLILPMAYGHYGINGAFGGNSYIKAVAQHANKIFGDKAEIMGENIPFEEYVKYLWTIDIAIFNFDRPCALGNIRILLYMGKKVFIPGDSPFYQFLIDQGVKIFNTNDIGKMSYEEFIEPVHDTDLSWIKDYMNNDSAIAHWIEMFEDLDMQNKEQGDDKQ